MTQHKYATLFGGALDITDTPEYLDTICIGHILAEKGYVVKNGGYGGMMEAVSKGASEGGTKVIGYTCATFPSTQGNKYLSVNLIRDDIYERLSSLITGSELFIVQRGGLGTLAELFLTLDIIRKNRHTQPKVVLIGDFWLDIMKSIEPIIHKNERKLYTIVSNSEGLKALLK